MSFLTPLISFRRGKKNDLNTKYLQHGSIKTDLEKNMES